MLLFLFFLLFIGIAAGLAWFLIFHDHGEREPVGALWLALGMGVLGAVPAAFFESDVLHVHAGLNGPAPFISMLGVGVIEEACKFLPLALFIYKKRYFNEYTDGVIYFALAGIGFGVPENILYTAVYGMRTGFARLLLTPFFHAATTSLVGYYLIKQKLGGRHLLWVAVPLAAAMVIHGVYDFGLSSGSAVLTAISILITFSLSGTLFVLYQKATTLDQEEGRSAVGHNSFCRSCGFPNRGHHLYCTQCGKNA